MPSQPSLEMQAGTASHAVAPVAPLAEGLQSEEVTNVAERRSVRFSSDTQSEGVPRSCMFVWLIFLLVNFAVPLSRFTRQARSAMAICAV